MPFQIKQDDKTITVYTEEELEQAKADARKGMLTEEEANSRAANARRDAETKVKGLEKDLEAAKGNQEETERIKGELEKAKSDILSAVRKSEWLKTTVALGLPVPTADFLFDHPKFKDVQFGNDEEKNAVKQLITETLGESVFKTEQNQGQGNQGQSGTGNNSSQNNGNQNGNGGTWMGQGGSPGQGKQDGQPQGLASALSAFYSK